MINLFVKKIDDEWFGVSCDDSRVFGTSFADTEKTALRCLLSGLPFNVPFQIVSEASTFAENVLLMVKEGYDGNGISKPPPLATEHLTVYTQRVLRVTSLVEVGFVSTYGAIARASGGGPRAVGNVMASNPFAPFVPCHRVVSSNFTLGGYGGGLDVKLGLLTREKRGYPSPVQIPVGDRLLDVFPVEFVLENKAVRKMIS